MEITFTLTLADYREARKAMGFSNRWLRYGALAFSGLLLFAAGVRDWCRAGDDPNAPTTLLTFTLDILPVGVIIAGWIGVFIAARRQTLRCSDITGRMCWVLAALGVMGLVVGAILIVAGHAQLSELFWFVPMGVVLAAFVVRQMIMGGIDRKLWDALVDQHRPKRLELRPEGIVQNDGVSRVEYHWPAFTASRETKSLFLLLPNRYSMFMVPKRAFADAAEAGEFAKAIRDGIAPRTGGFPVMPCPPPVVGNSDLPLASLASRGGGQS